MKVHLALILTTAALISSCESGRQEGNQSESNSTSNISDSAAPAEAAQTGSEFEGIWIRRARTRDSSQILSEIARIKRNGGSFLITFESEYPYGRQGTFAGRYIDGVLSVNSPNIGDIAYDPGNGGIFVSGDSYGKWTEEAEANRQQEKVQAALARQLAEEARAAKIKAVNDAYFADQHRQVRAINCANGYKDQCD